MHDSRTGENHTSITADNSWAVTGMKCYNWTSAFESLLQAFGSVNGGPSHQYLISISMCNLKISVTSIFLPALKLP